MKNLKRKKYNKTSFVLSDNFNNIFDTIHIIFLLCIQHSKLEISSITS